MTVSDLAQFRREFQDIQNQTKDLVAGLDEPLFNWLNDRHAGVLLHPTSLPGSQGIGTLDENAVAFLEFLALSGFKSWQICPLGPTGYGDSPYQCFSAFAGNPYLIDVAALVRAGLLTAEAIRPLAALSADHVDFGELYKLKWPVLFQAHAQFVSGGRRTLPYGDFETFRRQHSAWLPDYARFSALKEHFKGRPWWEFLPTISWHQPREKRRFQRINRNWL